MEKCGLKNTRRLLLKKWGQLTPLIHAPMVSDTTSKKDRQ